MSPETRNLSAPHTVVPRGFQAQTMADRRELILVRASSFDWIHQYSELALCRGGVFLFVGLVQVFVQGLVHDGLAKYISQKIVALSRGKLAN